MGHLYRQPIRQWRQRYNLEAMAETGTWEGEGVVAALDAGFPLVVTVDVIRNRKSARLVRALENVIWYLKPSVEALELMLGDVGNRNTLWWLDAHLPERYGLGITRPITRTPLLAEVTAIVESVRCHTRDVFVCDDLRLYGRPCDDGPLPEGIAPANPDDLRVIRGLLKPTHDIIEDLRDTGYLVALPRK